MSDQTIAIIPARSGSKSIKDKNLIKLQGFPLLAYSIAAARLSKNIDRVIISTDSTAYADIAKKYGAEVPFLRPASLATDQSVDRDFMIHAMSWFEENEDDCPEYWVHLRPTTPLRDPVFIEKAVNMIKEKSGSTSLRSAHKCPESPFKWFRKNKQGFLCALTTDETELDRFNLPRQAYPDVYIPDGYVDIVKSSFMLNSELMHGNQVLAYESPVCTEVDSVEEIERLEFEVNKNGSPLLDYLKAQEKK